MKYFFVCADCGTKSDDLGKQYVRLTGPRKWVSKDCLPEKVAEKSPFAGGFIIKEEDF